MSRCHVKARHRVHNVVNELESVPAVNRRQRYVAEC